MKSNTFGSTSPRDGSPRADQISLDDVLNSERLPTLPEVAVRVIELAKSDEPDLATIASVVKTDPAICAKLLKTANSALMGLRRRPSSVEQAVPMLGANMVRSLVLGFTLADQSRETAETRDGMRYLWRRSLIQATAAEQFAQVEHSRDGAEWFLAGLLQDIGQLAMGNCIGASYWDVLRSNERHCEVAAEIEQFGFSHVDVGVGLCRKWKIDEQIVEAIATHHEPVERVLGQAPGTLSAALVAASHCADYLLSVVKQRDSDRGVLDKLLTNVFSFLPDQVIETLEEIDFRVNETAALFGVNVGSTPPVSRILQDAQALLAEISIQAQLQALGADQRRETAEHQLAAALEQSSQLQDAVWRDELTGVYNRRYLVPAAQLAIDDCRREQWQLGCLFLDVDGFKEVNDTHGHDAGDTTLREVAEVLKQSVRRSDYVIRYGGDEFIVLLVDVNEQVLWRICERIRERIADIRLEGADARVYGSIGALILSPDGRKAIAPKKLISHADKAMYESKKQGGNRTTAYQLQGRSKTHLRLPELQV